MAGIEENRVFDKASLEELKEQATALMECAKAVTEELKSEAEAIINIVGRIPAEAREASLSSSAFSLLVTLDTEPFDTMKTYLTQILDKLTSMVPAYDAAGGQVLGEVTASTVALKGMVGELTSLIGNGSLSLSLEEFSGKLEEFRVNLQEGMVTLAQKMELAMTFLKGMVATSCYSKDPVNLSTGNFYYEKEDLKIRGLIPLIFKRHYNALDKSSGTLGHGWSYSMEVCLNLSEKNPGVLTLHKGDGKEVTFQKKDGVWKDIHTKREALEESKEGYLYREGSTLHIFNQKGQRVSCQDEDGNSLCFSYDEKGRLVRAEQKESQGRFLFSYKEEGCLKEITDHAGRTLTFFYVEGRLSEVTDPEGHTISYRYDADGRIRAVKNARGILGVRNEYDEKGRVIRQRFPDRGEMRYEYQDAQNRTVLTERNGSIITYEQDNKLRNIGVYYEDGEEHTEYNQQDQITCRKDCNGNETHYEYDGQGNLSCIRDALGEETRFTYDANRKITSVHRGKKEILHNIYDNKGRLIHTKDALGRCRKNIYNGRGLAEEVIQPDGSRIRFSYDDRGNVTGIRDPYGAETRYEYDVLNRVTSTTDGCGNITCYSYDSADRIVCVTNPAGNTRRYTYNESGKVTEIEDFDGGIMTISYNNLNRPECITDKEGRMTKRSYDLMWNVAQEVSPTGAVTRYEYNRDNRLARIELSEGQEKAPSTVLLYEHDHNGNLTRVEAGDAALGKSSAPLSVVCYEYDALNRVVAVADAQGHVTRYTYDAFGNLNSVTDGAGNCRTFTYNEAGERLTDTDSWGNTTVYSYTELGQLKSITDPAERQVRYEYEPGGRLKSIMYPDGSRLSYTYDRKGNILTKTNSTGEALSYTYDCMDRIKEVMGSNGQKKCFSYDALGNVTAMTDANGNTTCYEYTLSGKLSAVTDALGSRTEYSYDALDHLICVRQKGNGDEKDRITTYTRNPLGQVESIINALGEEEHYNYDALGRVLTKTDRDQFITTNHYTPGGNLSQVLYGDGKSVEMEYDALNRLIRVRDWLGITEIERDKAGKPVHVRNHEGQDIYYEWGKLGERRAMLYPEGKAVRYEYDSLMRLSTLRIQRPEESIETEEVIEYRYDASGKLAEKQLPGGLKTSWRYDTLGQLEELVHTDRDGILDRYVYEYDSAGNKTAILKERRSLEAESGKYAYAYDALGRLEKVSKDGTLVRSYTYDSFGNRTKLTDYSKDMTTVYAYDALNRLLWKEDDTRIDYTYDHRGNLTGEKQEEMLLHGYEYGAANRLIHAWNKQGEEAFYSYNGLGHRIGRSTAGEEETYLLDISRPYNNLLSITHGSEEEVFYWDGSVTAMEKGEKLHYYLQDELGSPLRVSGFGENKENGYLTYGYEEFGEELYGELAEAGIPNPYSRQGEEQPFGYTGYRRDRVSGTYFAQAREYGAEMGRFISKDKEKFSQVGDGISFNLYSYCRNSPLNYQDMEGNEVIIVTGGMHDDVEFRYPFVETALKNIHDNIDSGVPAEEITWLVVDAGYEQEEMESFQKTAEKKGINFVSVNDKNEFITYINTKNGGDERVEDPITDMTFFVMDNVLNIQVLWKINCHLRIGLKKKKIKLKALILLKVILNY